MARMQTVVSVLEPEIDTEGNQVDQDGEAMGSSKNPKKKQIAVFNEVMYYLLHWGLTYEILIGKDGQQYPVTYTIGICQHLKNGEIKTFIPAELTVVGKEVT